MSTKVTKTQLTKLQKSLKTDERIGEALGLTRQSVHQLRKKFGVAPSTGPGRSNRDAEIAAAYIGGETGISIARRLGLSISQTYRIINAANGKSKRAAKKTQKTAKPLGRPAKKTPGRKPGVKAAPAKKSVGGRPPGKKSAAKKSSGRKPAPAKKKGGRPKSKK